MSGGAPDGWSRWRQDGPMDPERRERAEALLYQYLERQKRIERAWKPRRRRARKL